MATCPGGNTFGVRRTQRNPWMMEQQQFSAEVVEFIDIYHHAFAVLAVFAVVLLLFPA